MKLLRSKVCLAKIGEKSKVLFISSGTIAKILTVLFVGTYMNSDGQGLPNVFSWELDIPKLLVVEEVGGAPWVRDDEIFVNFKLGNHKDE